MGFLQKNIAREFIALPDDKKNQIVYKWPDINIRKFSTVIVEPDYRAVFMSRGVVVGTLEPGRHLVDAAEIPFLGNIIDYMTDSNAYRAELYFVGKREFPGIKFGGRLDEVQDAQTKLIVTLRAFGEYSLKVASSENLITNLTGTINVEDNDAVTSWVNELLFKVLRTATTTHIVSGEWPIIGLSAYLPQIEAAAIPDAAAQLAPYGIEIARLGNVDINISEDDNEKLKKFASDVQYSRLAGSFTEAARGQAMQGAGEGMAQGGAAVSPMFLGAGLGMADSMTQGQGGTPPPPGEGFPGGGAGFGSSTPPPADTPTQQTTPSAHCPACNAAINSGAKFCESCGASLAKKTCTNCGQPLNPGAKFCDDCGTPTTPPPTTPLPTPAPEGQA